MLNGNTLERYKKSKGSAFLNNQNILLRHLDETPKQTSRLTCKFQQDTTNPSVMKWAFVTYHYHSLTFGDIMGSECLP